MKKILATFPVKWANTSVVCKINILIEIVMKFFVILNLFI